MTMTLLFETQDETVPAASRRRAVSRPIGLLATGFAAWRAGRSRRAALMSLMTMDAHRLDDLGLTMEDVVEALNNRR